MSINEGYRRGEKKFSPVGKIPERLTFFLIHAKLHFEFVPKKFEGLVSFHMNGESSCS